MRTLILGFDAFDPKIFESLLERGKLPNLDKYVQLDGYRNFTVANPPQSEVSWTSIATGLDPGGHGIFDFVHRNPANYGLKVSLLPTKDNILGTHFVPPSNARTIFEQATRKGYQATALWWPATFPARVDLPVRTFPGLGTPDIQGKLGVGSLFTLDAGLKREGYKTAIDTFESQGQDLFTGHLQGPSKKDRNASLEFSLRLLDEDRARLRIGGHDLNLRKGEWSEILELSFKLGLFLNVQVVTRVILTASKPEPQLYFLPLQIHPLRSPWRYATPSGFVKDVWKKEGPFLTLGWPQDTTGLEEGWIDDDQFIALCESIAAKRERILFRQLEDFDEGILASVFDSLDRLQHMFLRDRRDLIESWYLRLDSLVGRVEESIPRNGKKPARIMIVSDHGFTEFNQKVHLNRWLIEHGYLAPKPDQTGLNLRSVDWSNTQAYALGLNSLYFNLEGREGQGRVSPDQQNRLSNQLRQQLLAWKDSSGKPVVQQVYSRQEVFSGSLAEYGPDLVIGYAPGYRASSDTGLGKWSDTILEPNHDHWGADHCIDPQAVPGVLFCNQSLGNFPQPSYRDIPQLAIEMPVETKDASPPPSSGGSEDDEILEERLKGLGYL
jgi:predicted AlkP superfamily phosphohydrolase/phosphomutase